MASKMVTDRQKDAEAVAAIGTAQGETLAERVSAALAGEDAPAIDELKRFTAALMVRLLSARNRMVTADAAHEGELADDPAARGERDDAASELYDALVELRELLAGLFGTATSRALFGGRTPRDPVVLERYAGELAVRLASTELPPSRLAGATPDRAQVAADLGAARARLTLALRAVAREEREAQLTQVEKNDAITEYDRAFQGIATVLTGLFILAGQDDLADRVRPSSRRPGRRLEEDDVPTQSPAAPPED